MEKDGLSIGNGYKLNRVFFDAADTNYIPFISGCIIIGPKGAKYCLDVFGFEQLVKRTGLSVSKTYKEVIVSNSIERKASRCNYGDVIMCNINNEEKLNTNDKTIRYFAHINGFKYIERKDVVAFIDKIQK